MHYTVDTHTLDTRHELHEGLDGSGRRSHLVVTVDNSTGRWQWVEYFRDRDEAVHWMQYA